MGCTCHRCGKQYFVDVLVDDAIWNWIRPVDAPMGAGLLCGPCILTILEMEKVPGAFRLAEVT